MRNGSLPGDYAERVYAGVLGKIIGVYLGRPFEGWRYRDIVAKLGEIDYYVHEKVGVPLIVTDDDISGTFTFLRALPDYGNSRDITPEQIGQTWLNYIIENRTILWWGGMGNSTEHTAFLRMKSGIPAPRSGSIELNGKVVAEQIGAQIFIDGWAMVAPGDPDLAVDLAARAARVSHDGEAVYGAQVVAAIESLAFVENDMEKLIDAGLARIPRDSVIARMIGDIRRWRGEEPDWRKARERLEAEYGYDRYGGNCHMVPNHGLVMLSLLYGDGDFGKSLLIVNTCGWDTDCNSANVGCIMGIRNGLAGIGEVPDWRGPVADRLFLPTADGGRCITDAVTEAYRVVNIGRELHGLPPERPKEGARFHFELPGSVQGFRVEEADDGVGSAAVENVAGHSQEGTRSLAIRYAGGGMNWSVRAGTDTFVPPEARTMCGYGLIASPSLYPGQTVRLGAAADEENSSAVQCRLYYGAYGAGDELAVVRGPAVTLVPGQSAEVEWRLPDTGGGPIARVGIELGSGRATAGTVYLDYLTWDGAPEVTLGRPECGGEMWWRAWVDATNNFSPGWGGDYRLSHHDGRGLIIQGTREWTDYEVSARVMPHLIGAGGLGARVQGLRRYYALLLDRAGKVRLVKALDGDRTLAETDVKVELDAAYEMKLAVRGNRIRAFLDGGPLFDVTDDDRPLTEGAIALLCEDGQIISGPVTIRPLS